MSSSRDPRVLPRAIGRRAAAALALACCALCGCRNGGGDDAPAATDFAAFVRDLVDSTSESAEPVPLNGRSFAFSEDPTAFDGLLGP
jgi:hypothetical protein